MKAILPANGRTSRCVQNSPASGSARQRHDLNFSTAGDSTGAAGASGDAPGDGPCPAVGGGSGAGTTVGSGCGSAAAGSGDGANLLSSIIPAIRARMTAAAPAMPAAL